MVSVVMKGGGGTTLDHLSVLADTGSTARHFVSWKWTVAGELMASFPDASMMP